MVMYNLTDNLTQIPNNLDFLIGLGMKLCPVKKFTQTKTTQTNPSMTSKRTSTPSAIMLGSQENETKSCAKMHISSDWENKE